MEFVHRQNCRVVFSPVEFAAVAKPRVDFPEAGAPEITVSNRREAHRKPSMISAISLEFCAISTNGPHPEQVGTYWR